MKKITNFLSATFVIYALFMATPAIGQTGTEAQNNTESNDDGMDWGWLGLLGLAGLYGLKGKDRDRTDHTRPVR